MEDNKLIEENRGLVLSSVLKKWNRWIKEKIANVIIKYKYCILKSNIVK